MSGLLSAYKFAGAAPPVTTTWNPSDKAANTLLTNGNLTTENVANDDHFAGVRAALSKSSGQVYWETTADVVGSITAIGLANASWGVGGTDGTGAVNIVGGVSGGFIGLNDAIILTGATFGNGAVIRHALDATAKKYWVAIGAGNWNYSGTANPTTGVGGIDISVLGSAFFPFSTGFWRSRVTANFGASAFVHGAPGGYTPYFGTP